MVAGVAIVSRFPPVKRYPPHQRHPAIETFCPVSPVYLSVIIFDGQTLNQVVTEAYSMFRWHVIVYQFVHDSGKGDTTRKYIVKRKPFGPAYIFPGPNPPKYWLWLAHKVTPRPFIDLHSMLHGGVLICRRP